MPKKLLLKGGLYLLLLIFVMGILRFTSFSYYLNLAVLKDSLELLITLKNQYPIRAVVVFGGVYMLTTTCLLPTGIWLNLLAGALWGILPGVIICLFSVAAGATGAFLITRFLMKDVMYLWFGSHIDQVLKVIGDRDRWYLFFLRLTPIFPYTIINIAFAFTHMSAKHFFIFTLLGQSVVVFILVNMGSQLSKISRMSELWSTDVVLALTMFALTPAISTLLVKKYILRNF